MLYKLNVLIYATGKSLRYNIVSSFVVLCFIVILFTPAMLCLLTADQPYFAKFTVLLNSFTYHFGCILNHSFFCNVLFCVWSSEAAWTLEVEGGRPNPVQGTLCRKLRTKQNKQKISWRNFTHPLLWYRGAWASLALAVQWCLDLPEYGSLTSIGACVYLWSPKPHLFPGASLYLFFPHTSSFPPSPPPAPPRPPPEGRASRVSLPRPSSLVVLQH